MTRSNFLTLALCTIFAATAALGQSSAQKSFDQLKSLEGTWEGKPADSAIEMVFIRAPKIERVGKGVEVIATEGKDPVAVRQGRVMAATFHPELSDDPRVHQAFLDLCGADTPFG